MTGTMTMKKSKIQAESSLLAEAMRIQTFTEKSGLQDKYKPMLFAALLRIGSPEAPGAEALPVQRRKEIASPPRSGRNSAPSAVRALYAKGLFAQGKKIADVTAALSGEGFHFGYDTTLKALQRAPYLRAEGAKGNRRYFQRYPPK